MTGVMPSVYMFMFFTTMLLWLRVILAFTHPCRWWRASWRALKPGESLLTLILTFELFTYFHLDSLSFKASLLRIRKQVSPILVPRGTPQMRFWKVKLKPWRLTTDDIPSGRMQEPASYEIRLPCISRSSAFLMIWLTKWWSLRKKRPSEVLHVSTLW